MQAEPQNKDIDDDEMMDEDSDGDGPKVNLHKPIQALLFTTIATQIGMVD